MSNRVLNFDQITTDIEKLFNRKCSLSYPVHYNGKDNVMKIEFEQMYGFIDDELYDEATHSDKSRFQVLTELAAILKVKDIDSENWCANSGCETCGHGSSYITEYYCWNFLDD